MTQTSQRLEEDLGAGDTPWAALPRGRSGPAMLGALSFGAAAVHFAVSPDHFAEWLPFGVAFACLAWFQVLWAAAYLVRPSSRLARTAIVVNAAVVVVWAWSRTIGLPIGPEPGSTEAVGFADVLSSGLETLVVLGLLAAGTPLAARLARRPAGRDAAVVVVVGLVIVATVAAMATLAPQAMVMG